MIHIQNLNQEELKHELARLEIERSHLIKEMTNNQNLYYAVQGALAILTAKKTQGCCDCKKGPKNNDTTE